MSGIKLKLKLPSKPATSGAGPAASAQTTTPVVHAPALQQSFPPTQQSLVDKKRKQPEDAQPSSTLPSPSLQPQKKLHQDGGPSATPSGAPPTGGLKLKFKFGGAKGAQPAAPSLGGQITADPMSIARQVLGANPALVKPGTQQVRPTGFPVGVAPGPNVALQKAKERDSQRQQKQHEAMQKAQEKQQVSAWGMAMHT